METCHEYCLLAALTLVPFHVFVGADVFQKRCSREAVGFFEVPVNYLFRPSWVGVVGENAHHCKRTQVCFPPSKFHSKGSTKECVQRNPSKKMWSSLRFCPIIPLSNLRIKPFRWVSVRTVLLQRWWYGMNVPWLRCGFMDERLMSPEWLEKCRFYSFLFHTCNHVITIRWFHDIPGCTWSTKRAVKHHDIHSILLRRRLCARGAASSYSDDACAATTCPVCSRWTTTTTSACRCIDASFSMLFLNVLRLAFFSAFLCFCPFDLSLQYCLSHLPFKLYQIMISHVLFALKNASRDSPRSLDELPRSERALLSLFQAQCTIWLPLALRIHNRSNIAHMFAIEISRFQIPFVFFQRFRGAN